MISNEEGSSPYRLRSTKRSLSSVVSLTTPRLTVLGQLNAISTTLLSDRVERDARTEAVGCNSSTPHNDRTQREPEILSGDCHSSEGQRTAACYRRIHSFLSLVLQTCYVGTQCPFFPAIHFRSATKKIMQSRMLYICSTSSAA